MKYNIPTIQITSLLKENVVTGSGSQVNSQYVDEVQTLIGSMSTSEYKARVESIKNILEFSSGS